MPPKNLHQPIYIVGEELICLHRETSLPYEAEILSIKEEKSGRKYEILLKGLPNRHIELVPVTDTIKQMFKGTMDGYFRLQKIIEEAEAENSAKRTPKSKKVDAPDVNAPFAAEEDIVFVQNGKPYEARVIRILMDKGVPTYVIHFMGWNSRHDEWVPVGQEAGKMFKGTVSGYRALYGSRLQSNPGGPEQKEAVTPKKPAATPKKATPVAPAPVRVELTTSSDDESEAHVQKGKTPTKTVVKKTATPVMTSKSPATPKRQEMATPTTPRAQPANTPEPKFAIKETLICLQKGTPYEAQIIDIKQHQGVPKYVVHYQGWNSRHDEKIPVGQEDGKMYKMNGGKANLGVIPPQTPSPAASRKRAAVEAATPQTTPVVNKSVSFDLESSDQPEKKATPKRATPKIASTTRRTMVSPKAPQPKTKFAVDECIVCMQGDIPYDARVIEIKEHQQRLMYAIHFMGWNKRYDEWVPVGEEADKMFKGNLADYVAKHGDPAKKKKLSNSNNSDQQPSTSASYANNLDDSGSEDDASSPKKA